jgi:membrane associated rhomboid family serine protease
VANFGVQQARITRGAAILLGLEIALSCVYLICDSSVQSQLDNALVASPDAVWRQGHVWTLVTSPFLQHDFIVLILHGVVLWGFVPVLERFWGTPRFLQFAAATAIAGGVVGTAAGFVVAPSAIAGLDPFIYAAIVAFGIVYAKQPVQFFGRLPLTGRQLMLGFLGVMAAIVILEQRWAIGAAYLGAIGMALLLTGKRTPLTALRRWRRARKLRVLSGGLAKPKRSDKTWLN